MSQLVFPSQLMGMDIKVDREPVDAVQVDVSESDKEIRQTASTYPRYRYSVDFNILRADAVMADPSRRLEWQQLFTHWARMFGRLDSFLFTDPDDSSVVDMGFAVGDGTTAAFQLQRTLAGDVTDAYGEWPASSKPRTNLLLRSQEFDNANWNKRASQTVVVNQDVAPDGTPTADWIFVAGVAGDQGFFQEAVTVNGTFAGSISLRATSGIATVRLTIKDRNTDTVRGQVDVTLTSAWQRVQVTGTTLGTSAGFRFEIAGQGTGTYAAWGAQVELASAATQYIATTAAAVTANPAYWPAIGAGFEPVMDLNGPATFTVEADGLGKRPLVQWSRTNLALQSQTLDNASWTKTANASVTADATAAPDGTTTADKLIENSTANAEHYAEQTVAIAAGLPIANVAYAKAAERTWAYVSAVLRDGSTVVGAYFDLVNGVVGTIEAGVSASMVPCANGFWRCAIAVNVGTGGSNPRIRLQTASANNTKSYVGVVSSGLFLWGGQSEFAFVAGDYIPTTTATVSRTDITLSSISVVTAAVAPRVGAVLAWSGSYYRRVRFDLDAMPSSRLAQFMYEAKGVKLISIK